MSPFLPYFLQLDMRVFPQQIVTETSHEPDTGLSVKATIMNGTQSLTSVNVQYDRNIDTFDMNECSITKQVTESVTHHPGVNG